MKNSYTITSCKSLNTIFWVLVVVVLLQTQSHAGQYDRYVVGTVIKVRDGDTISVRVANTDEILEIRLYGIDAPEKSEPFHTEASRFLSNLVSGKLVEIYISGKDRYNRYISKIYHNSKYINLMLVTSGMAVHYKKYSKDTDLALAEAEARRCRIVIWGNSSK